MSDIFNEVDEEVRREQLKKLWERYSGLIVAAAVIIVAAVGGWRGYQWWEAKQAAAAGAAFEAAVTLSDQNKHAEAEQAFARLALEAPRGYRTIANLRAAIEAAYRDPKAAVGMLEAIAADSSVGQAERDFATLRAAMLQVEAAPFAELRRKLEPIAAPGRTYRHNARELLALAALKAGDNAAAKQFLDAMITDVETPQSLRARAETLMALVPAAKS